MTFNARVTGALTMLFAAAACPAADPPALPDVLAHIAPQTHLAVVIPNLKLASDELAQCLEGMGKADLVGVARPIDLLKSQLNISVGIDDNGSAAIVLFDRQDGPMIALTLVPVNDATQFLAANFRAGDEPGRYLQSDGKVVYARAMGSHVAISSDSLAVRQYEPGAGLAELLKQRLGERGRAVWSKGDLVVYADRSQLKLWRERGGKAVAHQLAMMRGAGGGAAALDQDAAAALLDGAECAVIAIDFDPLALVVNTFIRFEAGSEAARLTAGGAKRGPGLALLPRKPFYVAASADVSGLGGMEAIGALMRMLRLGEPPQWMRAAQGLQFAAYPSPAGMQGGVLNDAVLVIQTPRPEEAKAAFKQFLTALPEPVAGVEHKAIWEESRALKSGATADAYEVQMQIVGNPPEAARMSMYQSLLFGNAGWRGFARTTDDALIVTFSQRPAVLDAALSAAADSKTSLGSDAVVRTMHTWIPASADVEAYVGLGALASMLGQWMQALPKREALMIPAETARLDPVGLALEVGDGAVQMTIVVPASVLSFSIDAWKGRDA